MHLTYTGKKTDTVKQEIVKAWKDEMRTRLMDMGIKHSDIDDETIESFYNFTLAIKYLFNHAFIQRRSTDLVMAGEDLIPQLMTNEELHSFMTSHALNTKYNTTREECIQSVETYMVEHLIRIE